MPPKPARRTPRPAPVEAETDAPEDDVVEEGLDLRPNGTIAISFEDGPIVMRRPRFGEFRRFREALWEVTDQQDEASTQTEALADDQSAEARATRRKLIVETEDRAFDWIIDVVKTLGDNQPPAERDQWPMWATQGAVMNHIVIHWRSVPLARIGR